MSGHAETIRRIRNQLPADVARDFDALLAENQRLREALEQADAVIALVTSYMDDLLDRARAVNATEKTRPEAGAFALYVESRLDELVARVAEVSRG